MPGTAVALRLDDVGAASKAHEVYGLTRLRLGGWSLPFPGNALFLKYLPQKFPAAARALREGARRGVVEIANHGYTHCVLEGRRYLPRAFSGNRTEHREFYDWVPAATHREHVRRAQEILREFFGVPVVTFVPPGNVFTRVTLDAAAEAGLRYISCLDAGRLGNVAGLTPIPDHAVLALHDRDVVVHGLPWLDRLLQGRPGGLTTVRAVGERLEKASR